MKISMVSEMRPPAIAPQPDDTTGLEREACNAIDNHVEHFTNDYVRFGPEGLYMLLDGKVHIFTVDVNFRRTLGKDEAVPVRFRRSES